jgi:hypothetical protein
MKQPILQAKNKNGTELFEPVPLLVGLLTVCMVYGIGGCGWWGASL